MTDPEDWPHYAITDPEDRPACEANGCSRSADLAFIGEGGDLYLCVFHGGAGDIEGWTWIGSEPNPTYKAFVDRCLREQGYEPIGWQ